MKRNTPTLDAIIAPNAHRYHAEVMERARMMEAAISEVLDYVETMWKNGYDVSESLIIEKLKGAL